MLEFITRAWTTYQRFDTEDKRAAVSLAGSDSGVKNRELRDLKVRDPHGSLEPRGLAEAEGRMYASL